jgi:hypothetical protein
MGRLKVYNGVNQLNAEQIRPVLDMHEFFFHCLEAIVAFVSNPSIPRVSVSNVRCGIDRVDMELSLAVSTSLTIHNVSVTISTKHTASCHTDEQQVRRRPHTEFGAFGTRFRYHIRGA